MSGPPCCENPPTISSSYGGGSVGEIAGLKAYITGPQDSRRAIILASDAFGYEGVMLRKLADKTAAFGYLVVVPDFFFGNPITLSTPPEIRASWINGHSPEEGCENAQKIIAVLKSKGVSSVGVAGFCWGGLMLAKLAKVDVIQAGVLLHPGPLSVDDIKELKVPTAILAAELDHLCPQEDVKLFAKILLARPEVESFVKIYPGVRHGWACRYDEEDEAAAKKAEEAHADMLNWLAKYVK